MEAIKFLRIQSRKRCLEEMEALKDLIMVHNKWATDDMFTINWMGANDMRIDIDEKWFKVDGESLVDWLRKHCECENESDKSITVIRLKS